MNEDDQLHGEQQRAQQARDVIDHPLYIEAMDAYRQRLMTQWADSPARDKEGREALWLMLKTAEAVQSHLSQIMETGKLAEMRLQEKRSLLDRAKAWGGLD